MKLYLLGIYLKNVKKEKKKNVKKVVKFLPGTESLFNIRESLLDRNPKNVMIDEPLFLI